jgi:hypothetical protein
MQRLYSSRRLIQRFSTSFSIDRSGLIQHGPKWPSKEEIEVINQKKEPLVPLVEQLRSIIKVKGPISVHDYMAQVCDYNLVMLSTLTPHLGIESYPIWLLSIQ